MTKAEKKTLIAQLKKENKTNTVIDKQFNNRWIQLIIKSMKK